MWPKEGVLGAYSLENPIVLISIGLFKLLAISITVLAGYRGGFIFPFMFAGHSIGLGLAALANYSSAVVISPGAAALSMACAINVAVTRTVLATPIVLTTLSARPDVMPTLVVASIVSLYVTGDESIIKAARKRWLRHELDGCDVLDDPSPQIQRRRTRLRTPVTSPENSLKGGNNFAHLAPGKKALF